MKNTNTATSPGCSNKRTPDKTAQLGPLLKYIIKQHSSDAVINYIDCNAGTGNYEHKQDPRITISGSPIQFLNQVDVYSRKFKADLIENDTKIFSKLRNSLLLKNNPDITFHNADNKDILSMLAKSPSNGVGIIYLDNPLIASELVVATANFLRTHPNYDVLIHMAAGSTKHKIASNMTVCGKTKYSTLLNIQKNLTKKNWFISEPSGNWQYIFLYATNSTIMPDPTIMHSVNSLVGKAFNTVCTLTGEEMGLKATKNQREKRRLEAKILKTLNS